MVSTQTQEPAANCAVYVQPTAEFEGDASSSVPAMQRDASCQPALGTDVAGKEAMPPTGAQTGPGPQERAPVSPSAIVDSLVADEALRNATQREQRLSKADSLRPPASRSQSALQTPVKHHNLVQADDTPIPPDHGTFMREWQQMNTAQKREWGHSQLVAVPGIQSDIAECSKAIATLNSNVRHVADEL